MTICRSSVKMRKRKIGIYTTSSIRNKKDLLNEKRNIYHYLQ